MSARRVVGLVLVIVGLISLFLGGISWTHEKTVIDVGPIQARTQERERIPLPPVFGGIAAAAGLFLLLAPERRRVG